MVKRGQRMRSTARWLARSLLVLAACLALVTAGCGGGDANRTPDSASLPPGIQAGSVATGWWSMTGSMAVARFGHTATLLPSGKVLVAGGATYPDGNGATAELFDPATGTWSATGSMSVARELATATLLPNGKVLVAGGYTRVLFSDVVELASAEVYDPATGTWSAVDPMHTTRAQHTATLLRNGKVLIAGGFSNSPYGASASAELYDPATATWSVTGSLATPRDGQTATLLASGQVLVTGGYSSDAVPFLASAEVYNPSTGTWSTTGSLAAGRFYHTATLLPGGQVLVAGGHNVSGDVGPETYDPHTGTWTPTGPTATGHNEHIATLLPSGKVLIAGGYSSVTIIPGAELYDPLTRTWSPTGAMNVGRVRHTATLLGNGKVLVAGGDSGPADGSAELYQSSGTATTTALSASPNPAWLARPVRFTATVTPAPSAGTVSFHDGGSPIPVCQGLTLIAGRATCLVNFSGTGAHNIVAIYSGAGEFTGSTSQVLTEIVTSTPCESLAGCNLNKLNLSKAELTGANLSGSNLNRVTAIDATFVNVDLSMANLNGADLTAADLSGANLSGANLNGANLTAANLTGALTAGANFNKATWSNTTCPDGTNSVAHGNTCMGHL